MLTVAQNCIIINKILHYTAIFLYSTCSCTQKLSDDADKTAKRQNKRL